MKDKNSIINRRDLLKLLGIGSAALLVSCATPSEVAAPTTEPTEMPPATKTPITPVEPLYERDVKILLDNIVNAEELGITAENITGGYFDGHFLFHATDKNDADYFWLNQGDEKGFVPLNWEVNGSTFALVPEAKTDDVYTGLKYFVWDQNITDSNGNIIVTYQSDGTPNTAKQFIVPEENHIQSAFRQANYIVPTSTPESAPVPAEKRFNIDPTSFKIDVDESISIKVGESYSNIQVRGALVTDKSLYPSGEVVRLPEKAAAELILLSLFGGWKENGINMPTTYMGTEGLYQYFKEQLALAQSENTDEQWSKVEFSTFADNLGRMVTIRPLSDGKTPEGVIAINSLSIVVGNPTHIHNLVDMNLSSKQAQAVNVYDNTIFIGLGMPVGLGDAIKVPSAVASMLGVSPNILTRTSSHPVRSSGDSVKKMLLNSGITVSK